MAGQINRWRQTKPSRLGRLGIAVFSAILSICTFAQSPATTTSPCQTSREFKQFDFWLGHWEVKLPDGTLAGVNSINREQKGCVLLENWRGVQGGTGFSINFFDQLKQKWVQVWTGSEGSQIQIEGGLRNGSMVLEGKLSTLGQANSADFRGTWTPLDDGRVRQFFEQSTDGGRTWQPWFEGFYNRIKSE